MFLAIRGGQGTRGVAGGKQLPAGDAGFRSTSRTVRRRKANLKSQISNLNLRSPISDSQISTSASSRASSRLDGGLGDVDLERELFELHRDINRAERNVLRDV